MKSYLKKIILSLGLLLAAMTMVVSITSCKKEKHEPTIDEVFAQLKMEDLTVDYDGQEHSILLTGDVPEGATVSYTGNKQTLPGTYRVTAKVIYQGKVKSYNASLVIRRLESVFSAPATQIYYINEWKDFPIAYTLNNTEQEVEYIVKSDGKQVDKNSIFNVGDFDVEIYAKESNIYKESTHLTIKLSVRNSQFEVSFLDKSFDVDGTNKTIELTGSLPSGYTVEYENNTAKESGTYLAIAKIKDASGNVIETHRAVMKLDNKDNALFEMYLDDFFVEYLEGDQLSVNIFCENPEDYGLSRYEAVWYSYHTSTESTSMEEIIEEFNKYFDELHAFDKNSLSSRQQIAYRQIEDFLQYRFDYLCIDEDMDFMENHYIDQFGGYVADFGTYMEAYTLRCEDDVQDIVNYILSTKEAFASYVTYLDDKTEAGYPLSDYTINAMLDYLDEVLASVEDGGHYYLADILAAKIEKLTFLTADQKTSYINSVQSALDNEFMEGVKALRDGIEGHLGDLKGEEGYWAVYGDKGKDLYILELGRLLGLDFTKEGAIEAYIKELDDAIFYASSKSSLAINAIVDKYKISTYAELYDLLEKNPIFDGTPEEMLEYLKEFAKTIVPDLDYTPNITIKEMDEASAKVSNAVAYYMKSALDNKDAEFITLNPVKLGDKNDVLGTLSHEGYPGHLYAYCYSKQKNLHNISKIMTSTAHGEGWATYVELKLYEYAKQNTTDSNFKTIIDYLYYDHLSSFLFETRLDVAVHYQGWNVEQLSKYLDDNGMNADAAEDLYRLLIETPASYAAYGYGKLIFNNLHIEAQEILGVYYDEIEFNAMLLSKGWTSLGVLQETYEAYMKEKCHKYGIEY
ncbi:MAG: DUF885 domain-containing protein [Anaeroplasmataceae bacterium]|nr:DUF885 domain-containing protein [Anaeroplasmataceae bacterium]